MKLGFRTGLTDSRDIFMVHMLYCLCLFNNLGKSGKGEEKGCCLHTYEEDLTPEGHIEFAFVRVASLRPHCLFSFSLSLISVNFLGLWSSL